ncbi:MAG: hypothetical protein ABW133_08080 [Polyangiaceae bacterium]
MASTLAAACSDEPNSSPLAQLPEAGPDLRWPVFPNLPPECDEPLPETVLTTKDTTSFEPQRMRTWGSTFYHQLADGIHATTVPNGTDRLVAPRVTLSDGKADGGTRAARFTDFWVDDDSITGVIADGLYTAPLATGEYRLVAGTPFENIENALTALTTSGPYMRRDDDLYRTTRDDFWAPQYSMRKLSLPGGTWSEFLPEKTVDPTTVLLAGSFLFYFGYHDSSTTPRTLYRTPLGQADPTEIAAGFSSPYLLGTDDDSVYVVQSGGARKIVRIRDDLSQESVAMPGELAPWSTESYRSRLNLAAVYKGSLYTVVNAVFQLTDDRRKTYHYVVVRIDPDASEAKWVRCLPDFPKDPLVPRDSISSEFNDIVATEDGVFVSVTHSLLQSFTEETHIMRVAQ